MRRGDWKGKQKKEKCEKGGFHFNKTYRNYLASYLVVLLLPLIITIIGYGYSKGMVREEIYQYHFNLLKQTRQTYDQIVGLVEAENAVLSANSQIASLKLSESWSVEQLFDVVDLIGVLSSTKNSNPYCDSVSVYYHRSGNLVTDDRRYPGRLLFQYLDSVGMEEEEFLNAIDKKRPEGYYLQISEQNGMRIVFYRNVYGASFRDVAATVLISIPWNGIAEAASNIDLSEQGGVILINSQERIIGNSNETIDVGRLTYSFFQDDSKLVPIRMGGISYVTSFLKSERWDVKYGIYTPKKVFYEKLNYLRTAIFVEVLLCLIIGIGLAAYFAKETFNPIEELLLLLNMKKSGSKDTAPYEKLEEALRRMLQENSSLGKQLAKRDEYLKSGVLIGILKGWNQNDELSEWYMQEVQREWESSDYRIILFGLTRLEECKLFEGQTEEEKASTYPLVLFSVKNVLGELLLEQEKGVIVEVDGMAACIFNISSEWSDAGLEQRLRQCIAFCKEAFELTTYAAVSGIHTGTEEIALAYEEAYGAIGHKLFWGSEVPDVILYDNEMLTEEPTGQEKMLQLEQKLLNCLAAKDYRKASDLLDDVIENGMQKDMRYLSFNQCQASGLVSLLLGSFADQQEGKEDGFYQQMNAAERLLHTKSIRSLKKEIHVIFDEITSYYDSRSAVEEPVWIPEVKEYLKENYRDPNLNISAIAERFHLSLSYMGRTFKKYSGGGCEGMLDYIHRLRLKQCKVLLDQGESVKAAAEQTGYIDSKAMIRAFKRYEGITPGQYKKRNQMEENSGGDLKQKMSVPD